MHRHQYKGKKYNRNVGPRGLLLRNLATSVILHEKVKTTTIKAKGIQPIVEKMITLAKKGDLSSVRAINSYLLDDQAAKKLVVELAPIYKNRNGGYTRIIKFGPRSGDNAELSIIELLDIETLDRKTLVEEKNQKGTVKNENQSKKKPEPKKTLKPKEAKK
jgi:large subunit ribosomal protein L17